MYEELRYRKISYLISIFLICAVLFGITGWGPFFELMFDVAAITCVATCFMWLKKTIIFTGLLVNFLSFNFQLLFNPLLTSGEMNLEQHNFFIQLEIISVVLVLLGLADSYFNDKYLNHTISINLKTIVAFLVAGTIFLQLLIRHYS